MILHKHRTGVGHWWTEHMPYLSFSRLIHKLHVLRERFTKSKYLSASKIENYASKSERHGLPNFSWCSDSHFELWPSDWQRKPLWNMVYLHLYKVWVSFKRLNPKNRLPNGRAVCITSCYLEFNGSHFDLPPSSIHKMAGLGGKWCGRWPMRTCMGWGLCRSCAHYVMVSNFQWKPFWLATQLDPQNDWTATQNRVNYDVFAQAPFPVKYGKQALKPCWASNKIKSNQVKSTFAMAEIVFNLLLSAFCFFVTSRVSFACFLFVCRWLSIKPNHWNQINHVQDHVVPMASRGSRLG